MQRLCIASIIVLSFLFCITATPFAMMLEGTLLTGKVLDFVSVNAPHILALAFALAASRLLLKEDWKRLLSPWKAFSWADAAIGAAAALIVLAIAMPFERLVFMAPSAVEALLFLFLALILVPMQTLTEELLTRALPVRLLYPSERDGKIYKEVGLALFLGLLFLALHMPGGSVASLMHALYYFTFGFLSSLWGTRRGGYEAIWGMHTAINLFASLVVGYSESPYNTAPLFMLEGEPEALADLVQFIIIFTLLAIALRFGGKERYGKEENC